MGQRNLRASDLDRLKRKFAISNSRQQHACTAIFLYFHGAFPVVNKCMNSIAAA